jgi:hypothetical protein
LFKQWCVYSNHLGWQPVEASGGLT